MQHIVGAGFSNNHYPTGAIEMIRNSNILTLFQINQRTEILKLLPEVFKNVCRLVEGGTNIKVAIAKSGMDDRLFYKYATIDMKRELKRIKLSYSKAKGTTISISKDQILMEGDERLED